MPKTILIARPHTFVVSAMKPFLEEGGYRSKDDLTSPERRLIAARLIQRHFRSPNQ